MKTNMRRIILLMLIGLVFSLLAVSISSACSTPGLLAGASWAPNVLVGVVTGGVPSVVTVAISNWNQTFRAAALCFAPSLIVTSSMGGPAIAMSMRLLPPPVCPPNTTCWTRGQTDFPTATYSGGHLETVTIELNSLLTSPAAITEVAAHEIGHTFGLDDCNGCTINSSVMVSNPPTLPAGSTINTLIATPGPTGCDLTAVLLKSPGYLCTPPPPPNPACALPCKPGYYRDPVTCVCKPVSPIILDISGKGFELTNASDGVTFDITGTGQPLRIGWTASGANNAFLALPGSDGLVHSGKQLFGNFTAQPVSDNPNGFIALAVYDDPKNGGNGDGVIDSNDAIFSSLRLWIDANHDGISQPDELHTLASLGVDAISLDYHASLRKDEFGNLFRYRSRVNPDDPDMSHVGRIAYDVFLVVAPAPASAKNNPTKLIPKCPVPSKGGVLASTSAGSF